MRKKGWFYALLLAVVGKSEKHKGLKLFRIPKVIKNQGEEQEKLTTRKRNERISTVSQDATNKKLESARE